MRSHGALVTCLNGFVLSTIFADKEYLRARKRLHLPCVSEPPIVRSPQKKPAKRAITVSRRRQLRSAPTHVKASRCNGEVTDLILSRNSRARRMRDNGSWEGEV